MGNLRFYPSGLRVLPLGVLLWCVVRCVTDAGDVESARCRVRCLAHLKHVTPQKAKPLSQRQANVRPPGPAMGQRHIAIWEKLGGTGANQITFEQCFQDIACTACLRPCGQPFISLIHCEQLCQEDEEDCEQSCRFLKHLRTVHPGVCPSANEAEGFASTCMEECATDADCASQMKCCDNGCGFTCQHPHQLYIGVPEIPRVPKIKERAKTGTVELSWRPVVSNTSAPILYMVQSRWNVGHHPSEHHMTQWQQLAQTTSISTVVRDVGPGRWYEFRVGAISVNGTRGFSPPTTAFKLSKEPQPPGPPMNLTEGETRIEDEHITVTVYWQPPRRSDLPVARYKIYWSKQLKDATPDLTSLRENKRVVPGEELHYDLEDLEEDTTYFVQVQAISAYGDLRLKSERCSMYITTYAFQQEAQNEDAPSVVEVQALVTLPALHNVSVHPAFFYNGLLKANLTWDYPPVYSANDRVTIHWMPEVCIADDSVTSKLKPNAATTHASHFALYDLRFDCRYNVKLQLVNTQGEVGEISHVTLGTPSCIGVNVIGEVEPDCPSFDPRPPEEPPRLIHSFLIVHTNITAKLMWERPASDAQITSYRLVWGQTLQSEHDTASPVLNHDTALTKVLAQDVHTYNIGNLQESTSYMVRLQALSAAGAGKIASIHFRTPVVQQQHHNGPPYKTEVVGEERHNQGHNRDTTLRPSASSSLAVPYGVESQNKSSAARLYHSQYWTLLTLNLLLLGLVWLPCR